MDIQIDHSSPQKAALRPSGRLDVVSAPAMQAAIQNLVQQGVLSLVVDMEKVSFMDSSGLRVLVSGLKALRRAGGNLALCRANSQVRTALQLTMLDTVFTMAENVEAAFLAIEPRPTPPEED